MPKVNSQARRYLLAIFFVLTFGCFWLATPLARISPVLPGLVASFAPAGVAFLLTALIDGKTGVKALASKFMIWRVGLSWYLAALGIPVVASLAVYLASFAFGASSAPQIGPLLLYIPLIFILAAGEEFGWRGYVLPRLLRQMPILGVALLLGVIHAAYHLPLWIAPGFPTPAYSLASFLVSSLAFGIVWTWLYLNTRGSVLIATLFHGAINSAGNIFFAGIAPEQLSWLMPVFYGGVALFVVVWFGFSLVGRRMAGAAFGK